jgi:hypothetical protein
MFNSSIAMKLITILASAALAGLGALTLGLTLNLGITAAFITMVSSLLLVSAVRDYAPRRAHWEPNRQTQVIRFPGRVHVIRRRVSALTAAA